MVALLRRGSLRLQGRSAARQGRSEYAARLFGAVEALCETMGVDVYTRGHALGQLARLSVQHKNVRSMPFLHAAY